MGEDGWMGGHERDSYGAWQEQSAASEPSSLIAASEAQGQSESAAVITKRARAERQGGAGLWGVPCAGPGWHREERGGGGEGGCERG